jgi:hypothetical protein
MYGGISRVDTCVKFVGMLTLRFALEKIYLINCIDLIVWVVNQDEILFEELNGQSELFGEVKWTFLDR